MFCHPGAVLSRDGPQLGSQAAVEGGVGVFGRDDVGRAGQEEDVLGQHHGDRTERHLADHLGGLFGRYSFPRPLPPVGSGSVSRSSANRR